MVWWVDNGYDLVRGRLPPVARETKNSKYSFKHKKIVTKAISKILKAGAASVYPPCARHAVIISPLGVVPKPNSDKIHLIVNMRYVNRHLVKRVFKF